MDIIIINATTEIKIQTITLGSRTLLLHTKIYFPEEITTILWPSELKAFSEQLNVLKVENDRITTMEKFAGTKTDISLKTTTHGGCPVYVTEYKDSLWNKSSV